MVNTAVFNSGPISADRLRDRRRKVFTAATTLSAEDSGALCIWNTAAGYTFTLPVPEVGVFYDFCVQTTITSVGAKVLTAAATFLVGSFIQSPDGTTLLAAYNADGTTIRSWVGNGTTTGGYSGDFFRLTGISATQWLIWGVGLATGAEATPFATS